MKLPTALSAANGVRRVLASAVAATAVAHAAMPGRNPVALDNLPAHKLVIQDNTAVTSDPPPAQPPTSTTQASLPASPSNAPATTAPPPATAPAPAADAAPDDSLSTLRQRIIDSLLEKPPDPPQVRGLIASLQSDGSWKDITYQTREVADWPADQHLKRLLDLAMAYHKWSMLAKEPALAAAFNRALGYWLDHDFQSPNWWYNEIEAPRVVGQMLLLMGPGADPAERDRAIKVILSRSTLGMTGQNRVWLAQNVLVRGLLTGDDAEVRRALDTIFEEIRVTTEEGIQPDYSFHQHGPQQQFGNYGLAFADSETHWAWLVRGTRFALSQPKLEILRNYLLQGMQWVIWHGRMDISGLGRQLYPGAQEARARSAAAIFRTMQEVDPEREIEYKRAINEMSDPEYNLLIGNRIFPFSAMAISRSPRSYVSVRMCSPTVSSTETGNGENLQGAHLADGATFLYQRGGEYDDIFPVWDWRRLPGVTCYSDGPLPKVGWGGLRNESDFVGGVQTSNVGVAVFDFRRGDLTARKAWFFVARRGPNDRDYGDVVCLGAGIHGDQDFPLTTTVNQCLLDGSVTYCSGGKASVLPDGSRQTLDSPEWVMHDGVGYRFLQPSKVLLSSQDQSGTWKSVVSTQSDQVVTKPVFLLGIEHGVHPADGSYAYEMLPNASDAELHDPSLHILSNTPALQAVDLKGYATCAVLYEPGTIEGVSVDRPCVLVLQWDVDSRSIAIADPTQKQKTITLQVDGKHTTRDPAQKATYDAAAGKTTIQVPVPSGDQAGSTVTVDLH